MTALLACLPAAWIHVIGAAIARDFSTLDPGPYAALATTGLALVIGVVPALIAIVHHHTTSARAPSRSLRVVIAAYAVAPVAPPDDRPGLRSLRSARSWPPHGGSARRMMHRRRQPLCAMRCNPSSGAQ